MCGIAGFFDFNSRPLSEQDEQTLMRQISMIRYRGPDAIGIYLGPGIGLGHARLSIIDMSSIAHQPMLDNTGDIVVVFNGEIYNFQEIRAKLEALGHHFRSHSDTEVIVRGYQQWGEAVVDRLRGMFAIALFDRKKDRLYLIRDRVGKKPLIYTTINNTVVFGSEIKCILAFPGVRRVPNYNAIHEYLTFQYVPAPMTGFEGIFKLPPGHMAVVDRNKPVKIKRYYAMQAPGQGRPRPMADLTHELVEILREATHLRMISDVPLGAFLSGGVDSSSVVAMMAQSSDLPVETFTIGFDEQSYDERPYARMVAERYGTNHHEMTVRPDAMSVLQQIVYHYGEPYADSSAIPTYYVSQVAREHVTVILSGDGGDENFIGYTRYLACRTHDKLEHVPRLIARQLAKLAMRLPTYWDRNRYIRHGRQFATKLYDRRSRKYEQFIAYFSDAAKSDIYGSAMQSHLSCSALDRLDEYFDAAPTMSLGASWADIHTYLPDDLLVKVDVASMAHSLEVRAPFLDQKLMEWANSIPEEQRFNGTEPKSILKSAMEPYLPHELLYRPKMGFGIPIDTWLRKEMRLFSYETLLDPVAQARELFRPEIVKSYLDRHTAGENWSARIWAMLMLEMWFRMWIDSSDPFETDGARKTLSRFVDHRKPEVRIESGPRQ